MRSLTSDLVGVSVSNDLITKTGTNGWGNGGLATKGSFSGDGYVEYEITSSNSRIMVGLSNINSNAHYNSIKYAIYNGVSGSKLIVYENGTLHYEGGFTDGKFHGKGEIYYPNGNLKYIGNLKNGKNDGFGIEFFENGTKKFEGEWKEGQYHGNGQYYHSSGKAS